MKRIGEYKNGTYSVDIYDDGTKIRTAPDDVFIPEFSESEDVCITERCDGGCSWCYAGCTPVGLHCDFKKYERLLDSLHPYTELAINGNDLTHPDLPWFLKKMKNQNVLVNMTVNQKHFERHFDNIRMLSEHDLIRGIGISLSDANEEFVKKVKDLPNSVIHVINGLLTKDDMDVLQDNDLKILILGFKMIGRGKNYYLQEYEKIDDNQHWLYVSLPEYFRRFSVISFDNLALKQLNIRRLLTQEQWDKFYMGDDGVYTFFLNLVQGYFASDSLSGTHYEIGNKTIDDCFNIIRKS